MCTWFCFVFWLWQSDDGQGGGYYQRYTLLSFCLLTKALGEGAIDDGHEWHCQTILHHTNNAYNHEQNVKGIHIREEFEKRNNVLFFFSSPFYFPLKFLFLLMLPLPSSMFLFPLFGFACILCKNCDHFSCCW